LTIADGLSSAAHGPLQRSFHLSTREFTIALAQQAGELLLDYRRRGLSEDAIRTKSGHFDIVTEADVASERLIFSAIRAAFPDHGFHGEESANHRLPAEPWYWVVDPLDGTTNYAHGLPIFAVNLALMHDGLPELGVTHDPSSGRTYWAERGGGAWMRARGQDTRLTVSAVTTLERALLATGFVAGRKLDPAHNRAEFTALDLRSQSVRRLGSAALALAWVAASLLEAYWEEQLKPWDWFPGWLLIAEAGGRVTEYSGAAVVPSSVSLIASNGQPGIHDEILATIANVRTLNVQR
jgi:myo-inositol-1(or 4)-monophosphatase